jgi:hypothetical protein
MCLLHRVELYVQDLFKDTFLSVERRRVLKDTSIAMCNILAYDRAFFAFGTQRGVEMFHWCESLDSITSLYGDGTQAVQSVASGPLLPCSIPSKRTGWNILLLQSHMLM